MAVSKRTWIIEKTLKLLNSPADYRKLSENETFNILKNTRNNILEISKLIAKVPELKQLNVHKFVLSKLPEQENDWDLPQFYGIPKIHKQSPGFRPIVPCHSALMNPCAKFVSKQLKPLIMASPTVIHGSKDLAIKLSKIKCNPLRRWWFVSGDVVAFYPNIPLRKCQNIVTDMWIKATIWNEKDYNQDTVRGYELKNFELAFSKCIRVGNTNLISQFQGENYLQLRGLAMGVADSPDLANLFGCFFEEKAEILSNEKVAFYGRYIDDVFSIVYAETEGEALNFMKDKIQYDGCEILWEISSQYVNFLDMTIYRGSDNNICWRPYRKAGNHMERIPWTSYHPEDIKRGTFLGEMSRLASLCSDYASYLEALQSLVTLYVKRSYPINLVQK